MSNNKGGAKHMRRFNERGISLHSGKFKPPTIAPRVELDNPTVKYVKKARMKVKTWFTAGSGKKDRIQHQEWFT